MPWCRWMPSWRSAETVALRGPVGPAQRTSDQRGGVRGRDGAVTTASIRPDYPTAAGATISRPKREDHGTAFAVLRRAVKLGITHFYPIRIGGLKNALRGGSPCRTVAAWAGLTSGHHPPRHRTARVVAR